MRWKNFFLICMLSTIYISMGCSTWNPWRSDKAAEPVVIAQPTPPATTQTAKPSPPATDAENAAVEPGFESESNEQGEGNEKKEARKVKEPAQPQNQMEVIEQFMDNLIADLMEHFLDQEMLSNKDLKKDQRFIYSAFVDESDYNATTPFGRLLGDALATKIQNQGFQVVEVRLSKAIRIHKQFGVVALSQDLQQLMDEHKASFVTTGSYTLTPVGVYVSAKIIGKSSQVIYASSSKWLPRSPLVDYLLNFREPTIKIEEME